MEEHESDIWIKLSSSAPSFKQYQDYWIFELQAYNDFHNILRLFDDLPTFFTTSETMNNYYL